MSRKEGKFDDIYGIERNWHGWGRVIKVWEDYDADMFYAIIMENIIFLHIV